MNTRRPPCRGRFIIIVVAALLTGSAVPRATKRLKIISENWIAPSEEDAIVSLGFRIIASRLTVEVAVATSTGGGGFLPVVNFSTAW